MFKILMDVLLLVLVATTSTVVGVLLVLGIKAGCLRAKRAAQRRLVSD